MRQENFRINQTNIPLNFEDYLFFENAMSCYQNENIAFEGETLKHKHKYEVDVYRFAHKISRIVDFEMFQKREIGFSYEYNKQKKRLSIYQQDDGIDINFTTKFIKMLLAYVNSKEVITMQFIDIKDIIGAVYFISREKINLVTIKDLLNSGQAYIKNQNRFWRNLF